MRGFFGGKKTIQHVFKSKKTIFTHIPTIVVSFCYLYCPDLSCHPRSVFFEVGTGAVLSTLDLLLEKAFSPALFNGVFFSRPPFLPLTMAHRGTLELVSMNCRLI